MIFVTHFFFKSALKIYLWYKNGIGFSVHSFSYARAALNDQTREDREHKTLGGRSWIATPHPVTRSSCRQRASLPRSWTSFNPVPLRKSRRRPGRRLTRAGALSQRVQRGRGARAFGRRSTRIFIFFLGEYEAMRERGAAGRGIVSCPFVSCFFPSRPPSPHLPGALTLLLVARYPMSCVLTSRESFLSFDLSQD